MPEEKEAAKQQEAKGAKGAEGSGELLDVKVITGMLLERESIKLKSSLSKIIKQQDEQKKRKKVQVIGGDSDDNEPVAPPSIVIEKERDRISKIIVRCPCGRHSELLCEYDEDEDEEQEQDKNPQKTAGTEEEGEKVQ